MSFGDFPQKSPIISGSFAKNESENTYIFEKKSVEEKHNVFCLSSFCTSTSSWCLRNGTTMCQKRPTYAEKKK